MKKGGSGFGIIVVFVLYLVLLRMLCQGLNIFHFTGLADFGTWSVPYVHSSVSILNYFSDFFTFILNIVFWFFGCLACFFELLTVSVTGPVPIWVGTIGFLPIAMGMGWMILELVRG